MRDQKVCRNAGVAIVFAPDAPLRRRAVVRPLRQSTIGSDAILPMSVDRRSTEESLSARFPEIVSDGAIQPALEADRIFQE
ncbi:hypothetical protein [Bradyrhizobium cajani]|uniref:hypothetical protein n=1 Tax=Bradyrhizobium cajani TaxID=1928661 RepID=UPI00359CB30F